jgi:hypothetical protein
MKEDLHIALDEDTLTEPVLLEWGIGDTWASNKNKKKFSISPSLDKQLSILQCDIFANFSKHKNPELELVFFGMFSAIMAQ